MDEDVMVDSPGRYPCPARRTGAAPPADHTNQAHDRPPLRSNAPTATDGLADPDRDEAQAAGRRLLRGRPSAEDSKRRGVLTALLDAASHCLEDHGRGGVTARQIADRAGVNQAMINYYFQSKEGLFASLYERDHVSLARKLEQHLVELRHAGVPSDAVETLIKLIERHFEERSGLNAFTRTCFMDEGSAAHNVYSERLAGRCYASATRIMTLLMHEGRCRTDMTAEHAAYVLCSLSVFPFIVGRVFSKAFRSQSDGEEQAARRRAVAMLLAPPEAGGTPHTACADEADRCIDHA